MKKICTAMVAVVLTMLMVFATAACGGNNGGNANASVVGTWKMQFDSSKLPAEQQSQASMYEAMMSLMNMSLTFTDDGKVTISATAMGQSSSADATYTFDGTTVKITDPSGSLAAQASKADDSESSSGEAEMKLVDGKLVFTGAEYMSFVKQ